MTTVQPGSVQPGSVRSKGQLNPSPAAPVGRLSPPPAVADVVRFFWIPVWSLPPGVVMRQHVLTYPAVNLVVQSDGVLVVGPQRAISHRDLSGAGWAVGALLRPAGGLLFTGDVRDLVDESRLLEQPRLVAAVTAVMEGEAPVDERRARAADVVADWVAELATAAGLPHPDGLLANALSELVDAEPTLRRVGDLAARLAVSPRTLQRVGPRHTGFTPAALIRRSRLQSAADQLRQLPQADIGEVAHRLGYADHAHLTREFRAVLGITPSRYRRWT